MKRKKRVLWIMVFTILIGIMAGAYTNKYAIAASGTQVKLGDASTVPGGEFEVTLYLNSAKEAGGFSFKVPYNHQQFEFISSEPIIKTSSFDTVEVDGVLNISAVLTNDITEDSVEICKLKWKAKDSAAEGNYQIQCSGGDLVKGSTYENMEFDKIAGNITVKNIKKGDIDGNGKIGISDALKVFHYVSGKNKGLSEKQIEAADINEDGKITISDAMRVFHHVSGRRLISETVKPSVISVTGVSLNQTKLNLKVGESAVLTAAVSPVNASDKSVSWNSSNTNTVIVDNAGKVTAKGAGQAVITVKTNDGAKTASCAITVTSATIPVTKVSISNKKMLALDFNDASNKTYQCNVSIAPSNATNKAVSWSSSDTKVATVDSNGKITAIARGIATITVKTADGAKVDTMDVYVYKTNATTSHWASADKYVKLRLSSNQNLVLDVYDGKTYNGAKVQLWSNNNSSAQLWQFHDYTSAHGGIAVVPKCNNGSYILDVNRGGNNLNDPFKENNRIDLWSLGEDDSASMWELVRLWDDTYIIRLKNTWWSVGTTAVVEGADLSLRKFDVFDANQRWVIETVTTTNSGGNITTTLNLSSNSYKNANPFYNAGFGGQCTAFVWGRANEKFGINLPFRHNAVTFWTENIAGGYYSYGATPRADSIAVWNGGGTGHVAYVENVAGDVVVINEANFNTYNTANGNWGGGYDGSPKQISTSKMTSRYGALLGYIYLK